MNDRIMRQIADEQAYQQDRWGTDSDDTKNTPWMWAAYICQYATKWMCGSFMPLEKNVTDEFRKCMVKVATLAISAIESVDRQREENSKTFYEE